MILKMCISIMVVNKRSNKLSHAGIIGQCRFVNYVYNVVTLGLGISFVCQCYNSL